MENEVIKSEKRYKPIVPTVACVLFMILFAAREITDLTEDLDLLRAGDVSVGAFLLERLDSFFPVLLMIGIFMGIIIFNYASAKELLVIDGDSVSITNMRGVTETYDIRDISKVETRGSSLKITCKGRRHTILDLKDARSLKLTLTERVRQASDPGSDR